MEPDVLDDPLAGFHPAVAEWFRRRFPAGPTPAQALGWRSIAAGEDTLIAAPTGSGKTLAGFLVAIDRCFRTVLERGRAGTAVVYVSPLRALTVDVRENLVTPLQEISAIATELGLEVPPLRVAVRNGDTTPSARAAMVRDRPEIVVTTPESLYLLLTAPRGRAMLAGVETVIVDEIHALARDKRGSHLALSLERLDRCVLAPPQDALPAASADAVAAHGAVAAPGALPAANALPPPTAAAQPIPPELPAPPRHRPTRIGLSATQRPVDSIARLLVGSGVGRSREDGSPRCAIVDVGHRRRLDVAIELPGSELEAVMATEQLLEVVGRIGELISAHRTTLVFTNTRRMAERVAHLLTEILGEDAVSAHHGSLSTAKRLSIERRLRAGELRAVVATASLELGIDVGPVDLVCQLASPRSIATFLQRVGRAEHRLDGVPKGRLFPLTRDELVECVALLGAVAEGDLDATCIPFAPLDILAQQIVAECAAAGPDGISEGQLLDLVRSASPYAGLPDEDFEAVVELVSNGVTTGRGPRGAHLHRDRVNGVLRARRGARLTAATSGGAIPELADYKVLAEPDEAVVGTVHEDWAVEAMAGDVFLLGSTTWRIRRVEQGVVRVIDAEGATPTLPFWLGEAPGRTAELADAVCALRSIVEQTLTGRPLGAAGAPPAEIAPSAGAWPPAAIAAARDAVQRWSGAGDRPVDEVVAYLAVALAQLGVLPTKRQLVLERFFDDTGGMQLVVHAPFGARVNRGLGLALRKKFCRSFDFELQAAANDDAIVLSLGPQHSFPLEEVTRYLAPATVHETLVQAVLPTPIFTSRWRWNLGRSLVSPRYRGSRHLPPAIQRMEADDLMAAIFPALAACQENATGPIVIPDHPIVRQTLADCMTEAIDLEGVTALVAGLRNGDIAARCVDVPEASLLAHEIISGRPYTYLDDAPLEERRTRAVTLRRGIPLEAHDLSTLDPAVVAEVAAEVAPDPRDPEELHELLCSSVLLAPQARWDEPFGRLVATGRAMTARPAAVAPEGAGELGTAPDEGEVVSATGEGEVVTAANAGERWCATERRSLVEVLWPGASFTPDHTLPPSLAPGPVPDAADAMVAAVRGQLELSGPVSPEQLAGRLGGQIMASAVLSALAVLEHEGSVLRIGEGGWCARRLVARIHARSRDRERARYAPVTSQHFMRFLLRWQHVAEGTRLPGAHGLSEVIGQLQGIEVPIGAFEESILPARLVGYQAQLLDELAANGELAWGRLSPRPEADGEVRRAAAVPSRATPVTLSRRADLEWLLAAVRGDAALPDPGPGPAADVLEALRERGALFFADLCELTGRMPIEVAEGLWDGVARGRVTADGFGAVRALLSGRYREVRHRPSGSLRRGWWRSGAGSSAGSYGPGRPGSAGLATTRPVASLPGSAPGGPADAGPAAEVGAAAGAGATAVTPLRRPVPARAVRPALAGGRWSVLEWTPASAFEREDLAEAVAMQLLTRWGVVFRDLAIREGWSVPWRDVLFALRRLEARGVVRGGRFVSGLSGEQYALPEALDALRRVSSTPLDGETVRLSAADPLNLTGIVLPGPRLPALRGGVLLLVDGVPATGEAAPPANGRRRRQTATSTR